MSTETIISSLSDNNIEKYKGSEIKNKLINSNIFSYCLLVILCILQTLPHGILDMLSQIIQFKGATFKNLALYTLSRYVFILKFIWAPFIENFYVKKIGPHKSTVIILLLCIGIYFIYFSYKINDILDNITNITYLYELSILVAICGLLSSIFDIAVDGWSLDFVDRNFIQTSSLCVINGQNIGYNIGSIIFFLLTTKNLYSEKYNFYIPESTFLYNCGIIYIIYTIILCILKSDQEKNINNNGFDYILISIKKLFIFIQRPKVYQILAIILIFEFCYTASDSLIYSKLIEFGLTVNDVSIMSLPFVVIHLITPFCLKKFISDTDAFQLYLKIVRSKFICMFGCIFYVYLLQQLNFCKILFLLLISIFRFIRECLNYMDYCIIVRLYSVMVDKENTATQITFIKIIFSSSNMLARVLSLYFVDNVTINSCNIDSVSVIKQNCKKIIDGYYIINITCLIFGIIFYKYFYKKFISFGREYKNIQIYDKLVL